MKLYQLLLALQWKGQLSEIQSLLMPVEIPRLAPELRYSHFGIIFKYKNHVISAKTAPKTKSKSSTPKPLV